MKTNSIKNSKQLLETRAHEIEEWAEQHFVDSNGVVYTAIDKTTTLPLGKKNFKNDSISHVSDIASEDFWGYENCGMTTSAYLQAMVFRYRIEKDLVALEHAKRCFEALKHIYDIGIKYEEGFFPKIYGGKFSMQTSSDQVLYCLMAFNQYYPEATTEHKKQISHMICKMVRFWTRHDYKFCYYNNKEINWPLLRFPSLLLLAYNYSNDDYFRQEYHRLLDIGVTDNGPEFALLDLKKTGKKVTTLFEKKEDAWLIKSTPDLFAMDVMQLDYKLRYDPENPRYAKWKQSIALMWEEAKIMLAPDGKSYFNVLVDMKTGEIRQPSESQETPELFCGLKWGRSTITARSAVQSNYFFPKNKEMVKTAKHILLSMKIKDLVDMESIDMKYPEKMPIEFQDRTRFFCGDTMSNWLWAYWQGRFQKLW